MIALINPNTSEEVTEAMLCIARAAAGPATRVDGVTARFGAALITTPAELDRAADAVIDLIPKLAGVKAAIVAAFGDPGLTELRARLPVPVTGLAEAGMAEAARDGRRFAVVTTTPDLRTRIAETAASHGHAGFLGTWTTRGDPVALTGDPRSLRAALAAACASAIECGAEAIVIGGGPLAATARDLARNTPVPLVEPLPAAIRLCLERLGEGVHP